MLRELVGTYQVIKGTEYLFTLPREVVGKCPLIRRKPARPTMPLLVLEDDGQYPTSSWNLTSGKEAADEALFSGTGNHSPL